MEVECPISCVKSGCDDPLLGGGIGVLLSYFLRSRCRNIRTPCISCDRDVVALEAKDIEVEAS